MEENYDAMMEAAKGIRDLIPILTQLAIQLQRTAESINRLDMKEEKPTQTFYRASEILDVLVACEAHQDMALQQIYKDGHKRFDLRVKTLSDFLSYTAHKTGRMLAVIGLQKIRQRDGYHVYWDEGELIRIEKKLKNERH